MTQGEKTKRLLLIMAMVMVGGFIFLGYQWYHTQEKLTQSKDEYTQQINKEKENVAKAKNEVSEAKAQAKIAIQNNTDPASKQNETMYTTIKKVMSVFYNFDPDNYTSREKEIKDDLSEDMRKKFFPQNVSNYKGQLYSQLDDMEIYANQYYVKAGDKTALVLIKYSTHYGDQKLRSSQAIWKVSYNPEKKQVTKIEAVGDETDE